NEYVKQIKEYADNEGSEVIVISAKIEEELATLDDEDREMFLEDLGVEEAGLDKLIRASYNLLGLATYFTAGEQEVRAWTFIEGMTAPQCAGIIHTDFERGFIRAETVSYDDLLSNNGMVGADRKSTRLNSSHVSISYAVFCLKKKTHIPYVLKHEP